MELNDEFYFEGRKAASCWFKLDRKFQCCSLNRHILLRLKPIGGCWSLWASLLVSCHSLSDWLQNNQYWQHVNILQGWTHRNKSPETFHNRNFFKTRLPAAPRRKSRKLSSKLHLLAPAAHVKNCSLVIQSVDQTKQTLWRQNDLSCKSINRWVDQQFWSLMSCIIFSSERGSNK